MLSFVFEEVSMLWVAGMSAVSGGDIFSKHFIPFEWYNDLATISFSMPLTCNFYIFFKLMVNGREHIFCYIIFSFHVIYFFFRVFLFILIFL